MTLRERFEQLEERERKLLVIFLGVLGAMLVLVLPFALAMSVSAKESDNERIREIIQQIADERKTLGQRQAETERVEQRYGRKAPALASFLAQTADSVGVEIPETQDRSTVPHGKAFKERITKIRLRNVGMFALSNFLEKIENAPYPISISKLNIRKRGTEPDQYDAEMEVSAYDREVAPKKKKVEANPTKKPDSANEEEEAVEEAE
jgi:type II secretory pathway pseudopilin PulG